MLGHSSIKGTVDTYGKWLPKGNPALADRLDDQSFPLEEAVVATGPKAVAEPALEPAGPLMLPIEINYLGLVDRGGIEPPTP